MPRVPVHTVADAPQESQETLEALGKRVGKVINLFGEMAHAPVLLKMYATTEDLLREESSLGEETRQAIHLAVAHSNACGYCQAAYTGAAKVAGLPEETTKDIRRGAIPDDEKLTSLLTLSREIAANTGYVADETWSTALEAGWSERELLEAYAEVVRTIMTNYVNHLVGTELDLPAAPELD
jgi:AhpD family alkylhydroperoxidase